MPNAPKTGVPTGSGSGASAAIGKRITLSGESYEIIGVVAAYLKNGQISETNLGNGDIEIDEPRDGLYSLPA